MHKKVVVTMLFKVAIPVEMEVPADMSDEDIADKAFEELESKAQIVVPHPLAGVKTLARIDLDQLEEYNIEER